MQIHIFAFFFWHLQNRQVKLLVLRGKLTNKKISHLLVTSLKLQKMFSTRRLTGFGTTFGEGVYR